MAPKSADFIPNEQNLNERQQNNRNDNQNQLTNMPFIKVDLVRVNNKIQANVSYINMLNNITNENDIKNALKNILQNLLPYYFLHNINNVRTDLNLNQGESINIQELEIVVVNN